MSFLRRRRDDVVVEPSAPEPLNRDEVARRLAESSPAGRQLADSLRPAVRLASQREPDAAIDVAVSKLGGAADMPRGTRWPMWTAPDGERHELQFFAQVDLAAVAAAAPGDLGLAGLPSDGQVSFFADYDLGRTSPPEPTAAAVLYSPAESQFVRCALRMAPLPTAQLLPIGMWAWRAPPDGGDVGPFAKEYDEHLHTLLPERADVHARHQLGGGFAVPPNLDGQGVGLLQLDSDAALEMAWGPGDTPARLVWTIAPDRLAAGDWSGVRVGLAGP